MLEIKVRYFIYLETASQFPSAKVVTLTNDHYLDFETFWLRCFPNYQGDWLQDYFDDMVMHHFCVGVYVDGMIVSCTDAASMPYMADKCQEIGINTWEKYRGMGYGFMACQKAATNIVNGGRYPIWSHNIANKASQRIAQRVGFVKLADVLTMNLGEKQ